MKRLPLVAAITGSLIVLSASVAAACQEIVRDPDASAFICGDPHLVAEFDNTGSNVAVTFKLIYWTGRTDVRRVERHTVGAGDSQTVKRFVRGGGRKVSIIDNQTGELIIPRITVNAAAHIGACPRPA